jgi:hypothetical protein
VNAVSIRVGTHYSFAHSVELIFLNAAHQETPFGTTSLDVSSWRFMMLPKKVAEDDTLLASCDRRFRNCLKLNAEYE